MQQTFFSHCSSRDQTAMNMISCAIALLALSKQLTFNNSDLLVQFFYFLSLVSLKNHRYSPLIFFLSLSLLSSISTFVFIEHNEFFRRDIHSIYLNLFLHSVLEGIIAIRMSIQNVVDSFALFFLLCRAPSNMHQNLLSFFQNKTKRPKKHIHTNNCIYLLSMSCFVSYYYTEVYFFDYKIYQYYAQINRSHLSIFRQKNLLLTTVADDLEEFFGD